MAKDSNNPTMERAKNYTDGAVGAGLVLIVLPCVALFLGIDKMDGMPAVGLPILAIFGIMILFGALALISTLFERLNLSDRTQALALPEGSIRAAISLALIVLFAIISIMLYQSVSKPYVIAGLRDAQKSEMVKEFANRVIAVVPEPCANPSTVAGAVGAAPGGAAGTPEKCFSVHVRQPPGQESTDLAKQLLILIGTLMTSVTSFYFASRAAESKRMDESPPPKADGGTSALQASQSAHPATGHTQDESHIDGCDAPIVNATPDEDLPASKGGVA